MLRIDLRNAKSGMCLALPVRHALADSPNLLNMGYQLQDRDIERLVGLKVRNIWVRYPSLEHLTKTISPEVIARQGKVVQQVARTFSALQDRASAKINYEAYCNSISELIAQLISNPQSALFLGDLIDAGGAGKDAGAVELIRHSSSVTYMSLLMGLKLEGYLVRQRRHVDPARAKQVVNLGLGAMLHDAGVTRLGEEVRAHYQRTGDEADPEFRAHTRLGYDMMHGKIEPSAAIVLLHHHQRYDGSGFAAPQVPQLSGERIHIFARIAGLADHFDRLLHPIPAAPCATVQALRMLLSPGQARAFDPQALRALFAVVPPYAPGSMVRLSSGAWAVVIDHNPSDPCRPVVQIVPNPADLKPDAGEAPAGPTVDLSREKYMSIEEHEGHDVSSFNFLPPLMLRQVESALTG